MNELSITVEVPGSEPATYRFSEPVVRVGRSADCHLAIYHEAIPRELCRAWLEDDGQTVRVEERPSLTNPLNRRKKRVFGGISGPLVELCVGPVHLRFFPAAAGQSNPLPQKAPILSPAIAIGVVLTAILLVLGICRNLSFGAGTSHALDLPDTPFGPARADPCDASPSCEQRALVLATRAEELLVMPGSGASEQVRAAVLLARASGMLKNSADKKALDLDRRAQELEHRIVTDYRRELLALRRAVESGNSAAAAAAAGRILGFGVGFDSATRARLEKIARGEL